MSKEKSSCGPADSSSQSEMKRQKENKQPNKREEKKRRAEQTLRLRGAKVINWMNSMYLRSAEAAERQRKRVESNTSCERV